MTEPTLADSFSDSYAEARRRFRRAASQLGGRMEEHCVGQQGPAGERLCIDAALLGSEEPTRVLIVFSGLHGVEGFAGSAIQVALLEETLRGWQPPEGLLLVMVHALNPYGFAHLRRVNEDNVDLNRNFLCWDEESPPDNPAYARYAALLHPEGPPRRFDLFRSKAVYYVARYGRPVMKQALAAGQYQFERGLFYGGRGPSATVKILERRMPRWLGGATDVLLIDFHTGLGARGTFKLLQEAISESERFQQFQSAFDSSAFQRLAKGGGVAYHVSGSINAWCRRQFGEGRNLDVVGAELGAYGRARDIDVVGAEFGAYGSISTIAALRRENQAHHFWHPDSRATHRAKRKLLETFAPRSPQWRAAVVGQGIDIVRRAIAALS